MEPVQLLLFVGPVSDSHCTLNSHPEGLKFPGKGKVASQELDGVVKRLALHDVDEEDGSSRRSTAITDLRQGTQEERLLDELYEEAVE